MRHNAPRALARWAEMQRRPGPVRAMPEDRITRRQDCTRRYGFTVRCKEFSHYVPYTPAKVELCSPTAHRPPTGSSALTNVAHARLIRCCSARRLASRDGRVHGSPAASTGASQIASSSATATSSTLKRRYDWNGARHTGHLSSVRWSKQWWQTHRWRHGSRMVSLGLHGQRQRNRRLWRRLGEAPGQHSGAQAARAARAAQALL